jgi:hypothetical protein
LAVKEELVSTEEGGARPIDEFRHVFLGIDKRIVVLDQVRAELGLALKPCLKTLFRGAFGRSGFSIVVA